MCKESLNCPACGLEMEVLGFYSRGDNKMAVGWCSLCDIMSTSQDGRVIARLFELGDEVKRLRAERHALRKRVQELEEANKPQGWTYSSLTNAYLGIPEGIGPSARTSMSQPLPPSEEISDG